jgi:hypothetical protein
VGRKTRYFPPFGVFFRVELRLVGCIVLGLVLPFFPLHRKLLKRAADLYMTVSGTIDEKNNKDVDK